MKKSKTYLKPEVAKFLISAIKPTIGGLCKKEKILFRQFSHPSRLLFPQNCPLCSRHRFRSCDLWVMGPARFLCASLLRAHLENYNTNLQNIHSSKSCDRWSLTLYNIQSLCDRKNARLQLSLWQRNYDIILSKCFFIKFLRLPRPRSSGVRALL